MKKTPFVHLHNHSEFSLLDGATKFSRLTRRLNELEMPAFALTDHGNLFGAVKFVDTMKKAGIKPILGCEVYVTDDMTKKEKGAKAYHLVLLVKNKKGYKNLVKLVSRSYLQGFYYKPRVDHKLLSGHTEGLIAMSACLQGEIPQLLLRGDREKAREKAYWYRDIFNGDFYLEIQDHGIPEEKQVIPQLISLSKETDIPLVATNDTHYLNSSDYEAHDALLCLQTKKTFDDPKETRLSFYQNAFYLKSYEEMEELFGYEPEALANSVYIADQCNYALEDELDNDANLHFPTFEVPPEHTVDSYLEELCRNGARRKYGTLTKEIEERLVYELNVIKEMGYSGYFIIVYDFIKFAKDHDIPVGPGRGSAAGSIIAYTLDITDLDPLKYDLLFERFLNPERVSMPDIDVDIADTGRQEVIDYVSEKYGRDRVCQIATFGTLKARQAIRDVGRVLNVPLPKIDKLAKMIPATAKTIETAISDDAELKKTIAEDPEYTRVIDIATVLEGLSRHVSKHAAGVVIADDDLENIVPLYMDKDKAVTTQFDKVDAERVGLLKIDFLGLKNLSIIKEAVLAVKKNRGIELDIDNVDITESAVYEMLSEGKTFGVFQFESSGMREYLKKLKPERLEDLIAMNALYRPGPMDMIDTFIKRKQGLEPITYKFEEIRSILDETYGVIVYQEQVMRISNIIAGFSMGEADNLRSAMAKKKHGLIEELGKKFMDGAVERGHDPADVKELWDMIAKFGQYGFNKSHSACYAYVAYQTAYLKCLYPQEYMAAQLTNDAGNAERMDLGMRECGELGFKILPPDINTGGCNFTTDGKNITYALGAIKNVGRAAVESIIEERKKNGPYGSPEDFFQRIDYTVVNRKVLEYLIYSGALDSLGLSRKTLFTNIDILCESGRQKKENTALGVASLFEEDEIENDIPLLRETGEWRNWDKFRFEKDSLGIYLTGHMLDGYRDVILQYAHMDIYTLKQTPPGSLQNRNILLGGIMSNISRRVSKDGKKYITALFEDMSSQVDIIAFNGAAVKHSEKFQEETLLFIEGKVLTDDFNGDGEDQRPSIKISISDIHNEKEMYKSSQKILHLTIPEGSIGDGLGLQLKELFSACPGDTPLMMHVRETERDIVFRAGKGYNIELKEELFHELEKLLGKDSYRVEIIK